MGYNIVGNNKEKYDQGKQDIWEISLKPKTALQNEVCYCILALYFSLNHS